jgi:hypothetical protein
MFKIMSFIARLILSPFVGIYKETKFVLNSNDPSFSSFKSQIKYSLYVYFLPLTAAWRGFKNEWRRGVNAN